MVLYDVAFIYIYLYVLENHSIELGGEQGVVYLVVGETKIVSLMAGKACELCSDRARLYCTSDAAFLCYSCDAHVHKANFLVARHCRELLCARCAAFAGRSFSGAASSRDSPLCRSCSVANQKPAVDEDVSDSESSSLTCASSSGASSAASVGRGGGRRSERPAEERAAGALESWCRRLGWGARRRLAAAAAWRSATSAAMPMRVGLAAALWYAAGRRGGGAAELGRLERLSGVPARVIVRAEGRLRKFLMRMKPINNDGPKDDDEEGWAEC